MEAGTATAPDHPKARRKRQARWLLLLLVVLLGVLFDWNWYRGPIERQVTAATGREFRIQGDLDVDLHWARPTVIANGIMLGNADWAERRTMLEVQRVEIVWAIWHVWRGDIVLPRVRLVGPELRLERNDEGLANWNFGEPDPDREPLDLPRIDQLLVEDGRFHLREAQYQTDLSVDVRSGEPELAEGFAPLLLSGDGRYRRSDFQLQGKIDSPLSLADAEERFRIDLVARAGGTRARVLGGLATPLQLADFALGLEISGDDMAQLYPLLGLALPKTSAYDLKGQLGRTGQVWSYRKFSGTVGDSDLSGNLSVDTRQPRSALKADLRSQRLDFDDLAGFIGGTPRMGEGDRAAVVTPNRRFFPSDPYDLAKLRAMDADVRLRATKVISPTLPLEAMDAHLKLVDGDLHLDPFDLTLAGGSITSRVHLDSRQDPMAAAIDLRARGMELPKLVPNSAPESAGRIGGRVAITGRGNSVAALMATADGEVGVAMGPGRISNLTLEMAGLDIAEALKFLIGKDKVVPVRCGFADFSVASGEMTTRAFAFDTTDTLLLADGTINLGDESLDLLLRPRPKDSSPLSLRSPLRVRGTLMDPTIRPQGGPLALRGAIAAALFAIAPPAALLALVETGPGENVDCAGGADAQVDEKARASAEP
ncbi:MAG: AsmA family protein [Arenimonas sp.]|uniref:AsmA family protein n=1 Tax=Arenimonas sp. TaxID=1872635 RepID=UPI0025BD8921|nr:AsmA family protein [Arenimonas sp.]MBW8368958.1 AsmA family protein [Arenimonas sp.]